MHLSLLLSFPPASHPTQVSTSVSSSFSVDSEHHVWNSWTHKSCSSTPPWGAWTLSPAQLKELRCQLAVRSSLWKTSSWLEQIRMQLSCTCLEHQQLTLLHSPCQAINSGSRSQDGASPEWRTSKVRMSSHLRNNPRSALFPCFQTFSLLAGN